MKQQAYTVKDYMPGKKAFAVNQNREVEIISALQKDDIILVKVKGFDTTNPDKVVSIAHAVNGQLYLKPINGEAEKAIEDVEFLDVPADATGDDVDAGKSSMLIDEPVLAIEAEPDVDEPKAASSEEPEKVEEPEVVAGSLSTLEDTFREKWLLLGLDADSFSRTLAQKDGMELICEITERLHEATKTAKTTQSGEVDWTKVKLRKFWETGELISFAAFLKQEELADNQGDALLDTLRLIGNACQYSTGAFRVKTREINTNAKAGYTEALRRLVANYAAMVEFGLVEDSFNLSFKQIEE